jgi:translation initiation factor 1
MSASPFSRPVYSTESGRLCPACGQAKAGCRCKQASAAVPLGNGEVRIWRETKGRGGKGVTVIRGVPLAGEALAALGKQLRTSCGTGGTVKDGAIELQGDHAGRAIELLAGKGWKVKRSGG